MFKDSLALFSSAQAVTATALATNSIDLGSANPDIGSGENLFIQISVDEAFTDAGSDSTIAVTLLSDDNAAMSSPTVIQTLGTFAALSAIGTKIIARIQPNTFERYLGLNYTVANGSLTTGKLTASIVKDVDTYKYYASGFTVS